MPGAVPMARVALNISQFRLLELHGKTAFLLEACGVTGKTIRIELS
jgi:hypothetical protein